MAATSVHKLGGSMTQSSVLNVNTKNGYINPYRVQTIISMLTTTSTSYILLASLDTSRRSLAPHGREMVAGRLSWRNMHVMKSTKSKVCTALEKKY